MEIENALPQGEIIAETVTRRRRNGGDEEMAALRAQVARLTEIVGHVTAAPDDDDPYPLYEVGIDGFFSRDCVLLPPGAVFRDKTGMLIPNQEWKPLNGAAERNMTAYLASLPDGGILSPKERDELVPQCEIELRDVEFPSPAARRRKALENAIAIKMQQTGQMLHRGRPDPGVPMMANVRIQTNTYDDKGALGHPGRMFAGGARPTAWPAGSETELYRGPTPAANKTTPVFGNVQSQPLGTVGVE
jgi:hypothetical protein